MKTFKLKKVLCTAVSLAMLSSALPSTIASAALDADSVIVLYENYFDGTEADVTECIETGITSLSADPVDAENQVLKMTSKGTSPLTVATPFSSMYRRSSFSLFT